MFNLFIVCDIDMMFAMLSGLPWLRKLKITMRPVIYYPGPQIETHKFYFYLIFHVKDCKNLIYFVG